MKVAVPFEPAHGMGVYRYAEPVTGQQIFRRVLEVASGSKTKSEEFGFGDNEFLLWRIGAVM